MNKFYSVLVVLVLCGFRATYAQVITEEEIDNATEEQKIEAAEYYFEQKQYRLSFLAWKSLLKDYPDNPRLNYMAAKCLLNMRGERDKALEFLDKTKNFISDKMKMSSRNSETVPVDAHFMLGQALHHSQRMDEALEQFNLYLKKAGTALSETEKKEADRWIQWTQNAKNYIANPDPNVKISNIGTTINSVSDEYAPVVSLDENVLYFTTRRLRKDKSNENIISNETGTYYEDVYVSVRNEKGQWSEPELIRFEDHETDENEATVSVSADGTVVYVYMDHDGGGDLYISEFKERGMYSQLENMGNEICTPSWETHCSITPDGNILFFTSNRPGGFGGLDIYRVIRLPNGQWSKAEILPEPINTSHDEDAPFIHPSGNLLFYSSNGTRSMGEYDIFYATITEQQPLKFSEPVNLGAPINTTDNDLFLVTNPAASRGYYSSSQQGGSGGQDICVIDFLKPKIESFAILKGFVKMTDGSQIPENISIKLLSNAPGEDPVYKPRRIDGGFVMGLATCTEYEIEYYKGDDKLKTEKFRVPCNSGYQEIYKELYIDTLFLAVNIENDLNESDSKNIPGETSQPVLFEQYFGYNKNKAEDKKEYKEFLSGIKELVKVNGKALIRINACASRVPTSSFSSNDALAGVRAENFRKQVIKDLRKMGVKEHSIGFILDSKVDGPAYNNDYDANSEAYRKFQYVKAQAE